MKAPKKATYVQRKLWTSLFLTSSHLFRARSLSSLLYMHRPGQPVKQELEDENAADKGAVSSSSSCASVEPAKMDKLLLQWEEKLSGLPLWEASGDL